MRIYAALGSVVLLVFTGCLGPVSLHKAVIGYDESVSRVETELILLNIARADQNLPGHYTVTSSIAATFNYKTDVGFVADIFGGPSSNVYSPSLGVSVAENPTLSIIPVQGEEFTTRVLMPISENKFLFFVYQGMPIDMAMRLMARGIEFQNRDGSFQRFLLNCPTNPEEYEEFRRISAHLAWLQAERKLFVGKVYFKDSVYAELKGPPSAADIMKASEEGYQWRPSDEQGRYELTKERVGRVTITNYDLKKLSDRERKELNEQASRNPENYIFFDIRPDHPGGDFPLFGALKLRSFGEIVRFVASGIRASSEYDVAPDPRTPRVNRNPPKTLAIEVSEKAPSENLLRVRYRDQYYSVMNTPWDLQAFKMLYQLFQMTVTQVSGVGAPLITISK